ncbi:hypothetical protein [Nonomuraea zeae]|uniref:Uncharacterized protein n=1 Tax=Nonomuraea zeae TaxID=1642303 RepID=A0A5S4GNW9_9ACTN|nr:hypothetical protein [Nonomuraea zeae]TMR34648.1 hypothetical protein ETD85_16115 [Nonomuraea zeae]
MGDWINEPIVDPAIPGRDRWRLSGATPLLGRPDPEPSRWVRLLFGSFSAVAAVSAPVLAVLAFESGHETAGIAAVFVFLLAVLFSGVAGSGRHERLTRRYAGRYVVPATLDPTGLSLLTRARQAIEDVSASRVHRLGLLDAIANDVVLPGRLWDVARLLRTQAALRAEQAEAMKELMTPELAAVLEPQRQALERSVAAVTERVWELEVYASRVRAADSALRAHELQKSNDRYRDLLAQTGDAEGLRELTDQADVLTESLREAIEAGQSLESAPKPAPIPAPKPSD